MSPRSSANAKQPARNVNQEKEDNVLAVITDESNGHEYYVSIIDAFEFRNHEYTVMYHYRPDRSERHEPEIVIMRSYRGEDGNRYFCSIRSQKELDLVFELFYQRYRDTKE